jgi:Cu+-exporting ATPase
VRGTLGGVHIALGNTALMDADKVDWRPLAEVAERLRTEGASVMYLSLTAFWLD